MSPIPPTGPRPTSIAGAMITLKIMHIAFMAGIGLFAIVVLVLQSQSSTPAPSTPPAQPASGADMELLFGIMLGAYALSVLPATAFILPAFRKKAGIAAADASPDEDPDAPKLGAIGFYTTALLLRAAMVEGWGLFGAVVALLTENPLFLLVPLLAVAMIGAYFPTVSKFERFYTEALDKASKETFQ
mgnify:CR=1 FL=1